MEGYFILIIAIAILALVCIFCFWFIVAYYNRRSKEDRRRKEWWAFLKKHPLYVVFLSGHPDLNPSDCFNIEVQDNEIHFFDLNDDFAATITGESIRQIAVYDKSVFQEKVTFGRVALLGLWAFAAPSRVKVAISHLVITWQDEQFTHHTALEYSGYEPLERANKARNILISKLKDSSFEL